MDHEDDLLDLSKMTPIFVHPYDDMPDEPAPSPGRSAPTPAPRQPAYGLVGVPASTVSTRDARVAAIAFGLGAALVGLFSWFGRRRV